MTRGQAGHATSFDFFGTLVEVETPDDPADVVADELDARGVAVPEDWAKFYRTPQIDAPRGAEVSLPAHVQAALENSSVQAPPADSGVVEDAVRSAFEAGVRTRDDAADVVREMEEFGPVGLLSNCSVPGLVEQSLDESALDRSTFDAVVTSVDCGWRKPDSRAFEAVAAELSVDLANLVHVGDDPETDGGASDTGGTAIILGDVSLEELPEFITEDGRN